MRRLVLASAMGLLLPGTASAQELRDYVYYVPSVAVVRVLHVQPIADIPVAELSVLEVLKGALPDATVFLPFDYVRDPLTGETPREGSVALILFRTGDYAAPRGFWPAIDAFRGSVPLVETSLPEWFPIENGRIVVPSPMPTSPESEAEPIVVDGKTTDWQRVSADWFLATVRECLSAPEADHDDESPPIDTEGVGDASSNPH